MIKATKPKGVLEPFNVPHGSKTKHMLVYIGNIYNTESEDKWMLIGTELRIFDLFRRVLIAKKKPASKHGGHAGVLRVGHVKQASKLKTQKQPSKYHTLLRRGVVEGDPFLTYSEGEAYVIRKRTDGEGYWLSEATTQERELVVKGERTARRNLRWSAGSFCHGQPTRDWLASR